MLKLLALLMCKDTLDYKANLFMDIVIGRAGLNCGRNSIAAGNSRLKKAFRILVYLSAVAPKKYETCFAEELNICLEIEDQD